MSMGGGHVISAVVRPDALNHFNYATIISLFDVISIIEGTSAFAWKFAILAVAACSAPSASRKKTCRCEKERIFSQVSIKTYGITQQVPGRSRPGLAASIMRSYIAKNNKTTIVKRDKSGQ